MKKDKHWSPSNLFLALVCTLCILSFAVVFTLNFRPLYYYDINALDIAETSGMPKEEIQQNYDILISYNSIFFKGDLAFATLPISEGGRIHFKEVKDIFVGVQVLLVASLVASAVGGYIKLRQGKTVFLKLTSIFALALPAVLGVLVALNWNWFFVAFHKLFFNNDYWIFDAVSDPVITILPDTFFMHCAIMILLLTVLGSLLCYVFYRLRRRKPAKAVG